MSKPMTNYNERLDEIIQALAMGEQGVADEFAVGAIDDGTYQVRDDAVRDKAKQAITSLIKELVVEAKPAEKGQQSTSKIDNETIYIYYRYGGYNFAIDQFEQNLLKALEEV